MRKFSILIFSAMMTAAAFSLSGDTVSSLIIREAPMYSRFKGVSSIRESFIREYDSRSGAFLCSKQTVIRRNDFFYRFPEAEVLFYEKDGKGLPVREYTEHLIDPAYPFCDIRAQEHYVFTEGSDAFAGSIPCTTIRVRPKKKTIQHFDGIVYLSKEDGRIVLIDGTLASLPFGVNAFHVRMAFRKTPEGSIPSSGTFEFDVNIPILHPHKRIITEFTATKIQLIN
jgi:hypothetical protein